jgi:hypothetical protein
MQVIDSTLSQTSQNGNNTYQRPLDLNSKGQRNQTIALADVLEGLTLRGFHVQKAPKTATEVSLRSQRRWASRAGPGFEKPTHSVVSCAAGALLLIVIRSPGGPLALRKASLRNGNTEMKALLLRDGPPVGYLHDVEFHGSNARKHKVPDLRRVGA